MEAHDQDSGCATLVADTRHVGMRLDTDMGISDCRKFLDLEDMYHHDPIKTTATGGGCRRHRRLRLSLPGVELPKRCCEHCPVAADPWPATARTKRGQARK